MKTTGEYAQDLSVIGLTGAARRAAIKSLYDADKAVAPIVKREKPPTTKELAQKVRAYDQAFHDIKVVQETEAAVAVRVIVDFCDIERDGFDLIWFPKLMLKDGKAPGWLICQKIEAIQQMVEKTAASRYGSIYVRML